MSAINPEGSKFRWQGFDFIFVTEPNHVWKNWLCFKHPDGQWVSLHKCDSSELNDWQSRALAAEQKLEEREKQFGKVLSAIHNDALCEYPDGAWESATRDAVDILADQTTAEQERDQLKAELQQARESVEWIKKFGPELATRSILLPSISELRAILERIEKEKSPH